MSSAIPFGPDRPPERLEQRICFEEHGRVVAYSGKVEYGQGISTGFAKIVADELRIPLDHVRVELGETDHVPWDMGTFGSLSTATDGQALRAAAAFARTLLIERAATRLRVAAAAFTLCDGRLTAPDGRSVGYEELIAEAPLTGTVPADVPGAGGAEPSRVSPAAAASHAPDAPLRRLEARDIVLGRARFSSDVRLPGMLHAHIVHEPCPGATVRSVEDRVAKSMPGVVAVVRESDFVAVLAERGEHADAAAQALIATWSPPQPAAAPAATELVLRRDPGVEAAMSGAARTLSASYHVPHVAHAAICPSTAVADVSRSGTHLYAATQRPFGLRDEVAALLGVPCATVHVHPQAMGGMFGRGNMHEAVLEAVRLSRAAGRPVLVQWSRRDEFRLSPHRPTLDAEVAAGLSSGGQILAWRYHSRTNPHAYGSAAMPAGLLALTSGRNAVPPYRLGRAEVLLEVVPGAVRTGALRSLAAAPNVFAIESFFDELAHASGEDPIAFRLHHVEDPRLRRVIETVRDRSGWATRSRRPGYGLGAACAVYHGTYVAQVAEVSVAAEQRAQLRRVWCAVDPGELIWPEGARNQIEGAIQQAASWSLLEKLEHRDGCATAATWLDYPIATFQDAPQSIDVVFTPQSGQAPSGVGEPGAVPLAAAIGNAIHEATGRRLRALPLRPDAPSGASDAEV